MTITRREVVSGSLLLLGGCVGKSSNNSEHTPTKEINQSNERAESSSQMCNTYEGDEKRTEAALRLYKGSYDGLKSGQEVIGPMIDSEGLYASKEEGVDANTPDGLILEEQEGGDVLITLIHYDNSALYDMYNSWFHDALEKFQEAQEALNSNLESRSTEWEGSDGGWNYTQKFVNQCDIDHSDLFHQSIENGITSVKHLINSAAKFEEECKIYLDNDADFEDDVPEAKQLQQEAVSELQSAADNYPRTPESLEDQVLVYRSE
ncbi:hypothetical protein ACOJIV_24635 [Haloarcula sp. AONF1]